MHTKIILSLFLIVTLPLSGMEPASEPKGKIDKIVKGIKKTTKRVFRAISLGKNEKYTSVPDEDTMHTEFFSNPDMVGHVVVALYNDRQFADICKNIRRFAAVNSTIYKYCKEHGYTDKDIIRKLSIQLNRSDLDIATTSRHQPITTEIKRFFDIASSTVQFSQEDLHNEWFLTTTRTAKLEFPHVEQESLLHVAIKCFNPDKVKILLDANIDDDSSRCINPLAMMAGNRLKLSLKQISDLKSEDFLTIVCLLMKKGIDPDARCAVCMPTLLHLAAHYCHKKLAFKLLRTYKADPYKLYLDLPLYRQYLNSDQISLESVTEKYLKEDASKLQYFGTNNSKEPYHHNAFTLTRGEPKGWLKTMYDHIQD